MVGVEAHLQENERIVSSFRPYHATSSRSILYLDGGYSAEVHELPYTHLENIEVVRLSNHRLMVAGTVLSAVAFFAAVGLGLITPVVGVVIGVEFVIYGGLGQPAYY